MRLSNPTDTKSRFLPLLLIAPFFFWGTAMVAMKGVIPHTTPLFIATLRLFPAGLLVIGAARLMGRPQPQTWQAWAWILAFAVVDGAMFQGFLAEGLERTGAGLGSVMIDSQPIAVALMARFLFGERIGLWGFLGLGLGVMGISLIGLPDAWIMQGYEALIQGQVATLLPNMVAIAHLNLPDLLTRLFQNGQWLMLLASLAMAVGTVMIRYVSKHADPVMATGWHMIIGGVMVFALSYKTEFLQYSFLLTGDWLALGYASIFGGAIAYGLFFFFASSGNLTSLIALTFLTPIFALLFGYGFLGEVLSSLQGIGVILTLMSIYLINQRETLAQRFSKPSQPGDTQSLPLSGQPEAD
ncbi:MAG: DMT family transporter [Leptolyngbyaceae bacterium]|nr:DMT family transporter [Leptolyngbyaceae bacterium]